MLLKLTLWCGLLGVAFVGVSPGITLFLWAAAVGAAALSIGIYVLKNI